MLRRAPPQIFPFSQCRVLGPRVLRFMVPVIWRPRFRLCGASGRTIVVGRDAIRCRFLGVPRCSSYQPPSHLRRVVPTGFGRVILNRWLRRQTSRCRMSIAILHLGQVISSHRV